MLNETSVLQHIFFDNKFEGKKKIYSIRKNKEIITEGERIFFSRSALQLDLRSVAQMFPNHHYALNTSIKEVFVSIKRLAGDIKIDVFFVDGLGAESLEIQQVLSSGENIVVKSAKIKPENGYFYIKLTALEDNVSVEGLAWSIERKLPRHKILLGITTFRREESLHENLTKIIMSHAIKKLNLDVMVIDNGNTVDFSIYHYPLLHSVQNNSGGTGGFMRILIYSKDNDYTNTFFMDDDIELEPEMLYRAIVFAIFCDKPTSVGLMMMKKSVPDQVWEQGAFINKNRIYSGSGFNFCLDATEKKNLLQLNKSRSADFSGWWGCLVPTEEAPLLPYMFIKGDDVVCGLILKQKGVPCITLPTALVWHEDFDKRPYTWQHFYDIRNAFVIRHFYNKKTNRISMLASVAKLFFGVMLLGDYYRASIMIDAFQAALIPADDYFSDPGKLKEKHNDIMKHFPVKDVSDSLSSINHPHSTFVLYKGAFLSLISFFGIFYPFKKCTESDGRPLSIPLNSYDVSNSYKHKTVLFYDPYTLKGYQCSKKFSEVSKLVFAFFKISLRYVFSGKNLDGQKFIVEKEYWESECSVIVRNNNY